MTPLAVALGDLVQLIWASTLIALVVMIAFAVALRGATLAGERRRAGRGSAATAQMAMALAAGAIFVGTVAAGVYVIVAG